MKVRLLILLVTFLTLLASMSITASSQTVVTFDDLTETASGSFITTPYHSLVWSNFLCLNSVLSNAKFGPDGTYYGMVSASNVVINGSFFGTTAEIDSTASNFNFLSVYLAGAQRSNLNIEVEGFRSGGLLYDTTVVASATSPTLFNFNYLNIDQLVFNSSGGQTAFFGGQESLVMDNFTFDLVPEPSAFLLAGFGALMLCPLLKRRRT